MKQIFILFSHELSQQQIYELKNEFKVEKFVYLPKNLQEKLSNVPPEISDLSEFAQPFKEFLQSNFTKNDIALIQGDFGLSYLLINFCKNIGIEAIYATTKRNIVEKEINGKVIKQSIFEHIRFRKY